MLEGTYFNRYLTVPITQGVTAWLSYAMEARGPRRFLIELTDYVSRRTVKRHRQPRQLDIQSASSAHYRSLSQRNRGAGPRSSAIKRVAVADALSVGLVREPFAGARLAAVPAALAVGCFAYPCQSLGGARLHIRQRRLARRDVQQSDPRPRLRRPL